MPRAPPSGLDGAVAVALAVAPDRAFRVRHAQSRGICPKLGRARRCVVVDGNFDVVGLHARGIENVVAPLGTAFTLEQAGPIERYTGNVTFLFDGSARDAHFTRAFPREPGLHAARYARQVRERSAVRLSRVCAAPGLGPRAAAPRVWRPMPARLARER